MTDDTIRAERRRILDQALPEVLRTSHAREPRLRSVLLAVSQYWNDSADDEVHLHVVGSSRGAPGWPHECDDEQPERAQYDDCWACDAIGYGPIGGYLDLIPLFEAYCFEGAHQGQSHGEAYRAIATARLGDDGAVAVHGFGALARPWLDLPVTRAPAAPPLDPSIRGLLEAARDDRAAVAVLADALGERGDPRGELIALARAGAATAALEDTWGRAWLGALDPWVPRAGVRFADGLPRDVELFVSPEQVDELGWLDPDDDAWAVIERVRFGSRSQVAIVPAFRRLRGLGTLDGDQIAELLTGAPFALEHLAMVVDADAVEGVLASDRLPRLRTLELIGAADDLAAALPPLRAAPRRLERVDVVVDSRDAGALVAAVAAWSTAGLDVPVRIAALDDDTGRPTGLAVEVRGGHARVERVGHPRGPSPPRLDDLLAALPAGTHVERVAGPLWDPHLP